MKVYSLLACLLVSGCSNFSGENIRNTAILGDGMTTAYALTAAKGITEANPVMNTLGGGSGFGIGVVATGLSYGIQNAARKYAPAETCERTYNSLTAMKMGAVGNNLAVLAGAGEPTAVALMAGFVTWNSLQKDPAAIRFCRPKRVFELKNSFTVTPQKTIFAQPIATEIKR